MMREEASKGIRRALGLGLIAAATALAACGGGSPTTAAIDLTSPGVEDGVTRPSIRCGWGSVWFPLKWGEVPEDTKELAIYIGRYKYVGEGSQRKVVVPFADLISHLDPSLRGLPTNLLPDGAGWSKVGPVPCPVSAKGQRIVLEILALDRIQERRTLKMGLATRLTEEILDDPHPDQSPRSPGELTRDATGVGRLTATYTGPHGY